MTESSTASPEQQGLFPGSEVERVAPAQHLVDASPASPPPTTCDVDDERAARTRNSMMWAAYGDALGFVSELVDQKGLERRTQGAPLGPPDGLETARRRQGGRQCAPSRRMLVR